VGVSSGSVNTVDGIVTRGDESEFMVWSRTSTGIGIGV